MDLHGVSKASLAADIRGEGKLARGLFKKDLRDPH